MWCVAELDDDYIAKMEDVLEMYERPYDPQQPVVCLDEKPVTLHADVRPRAALPGREARRDNEYKRCGTANVFCAVEPKAGRHFTFATPDRSGFEFAQWFWRLPSHTRKRKRSIWSWTTSTSTAASRWSTCSARKSAARFGSGSRPLHAQARQLAQSGGNRDRHAFSAMPGDAQTC